MSSKNKKVSDLCENPEDQEKEIHEILLNNKDFIAVIISVNFLDDCLSSLLKSIFIESSVSERLLKPQGILGNFSNKTDLCYALKIINKATYNDLRKFGEIRNKFAHRSLELSFESTEIKQLCSQLSIIESYNHQPGIAPFLESLLTNNPKNQFVISMVMIRRNLVTLSKSLLS